MYLIFQKLISTTVTVIYFPSSAIELTEMALCKFLYYCIIIIIKLGIKYYAFLEFWYREY